MKKTRFPLILALLCLGTAFVINGFFIVDQREKALVLQFGELVRIHTTPGLKFKVPLVQDVVTYDSRLLDFHLPILEVTAGDQKRMVIDIYTRYLIKDVLLFYKKVRNNTGAQNRLETIVEASMRRVMGRFPLSDMLSEKRDKIMAEIQKIVEEAAEQYGIEVLDVRIIRADLPPQNREAIFRRMESERHRESKLFRAEGREKSQEVKAEAERQKTVIIADAERQANVIMGEADAEAARLYAEAYQRDIGFYTFYRSLEAYEEAFSASDTTILLSLTSPFFKYFMPKIEPSKNQAE